MSNPAVIKLVRCKIDGMPFYMDDNIGESIHIHLGNIRLDLTIEELHILCAELRSAINLLVDVEGFDCNNIDPVYMSLFLAPMLENLEKVAIDTVDVSKLIVGYEKHGLVNYMPVQHSRVIEALNGNPKVNDDHRRSHHIGQTSQQRVDDMVNSINKNGYPFDGKLVILYDEQMLVRDGQHRCSCIFLKYGAKHIPVQRLFFKDSNLIKYDVGIIPQLFHKMLKLDAKHITSFFGRSVRFLQRKYRHWCHFFYIRRNKKALNDLNKVFFS